MDVETMKDVERKTTREEIIVRIIIFICGIFLGFILTILYFLFAAGFFSRGG